MNMNKFRTDLIAKLKKEERSVSSIAHEFSVEQGSLSRFIRGKQEGLSGKTVFSLWSFVYGDTAPSCSEQPSAMPNNYSSSVT